VDLDFASKYGLTEAGAGYSIKSLATARLNQEKLELHVYPALISRKHPLASVRNEYNAVYIRGELSGPQLYAGRGAGREATSSAVISDVLRVAENLKKGVVNDLPSLDSRVQFADVRTIERRGYVRINLKHAPGSIARASQIMADHGFNLEDSIQRRRFQLEVNGETVIPDIVTAEPLAYATVEGALRDLQDSDRVLGKPFYLRFVD
jgi:homoserine dehydrogenase